MAASFPPFSVLLSCLRLLRPGKSSALPARPYGCGARLRWGALAGLLLWALLPAPAAWGASTAPRNLLAHGANGQLWMAQVEKSPDTGRPVTTLLGRKIGEKESWQRYGEIQSRVVGLSNRGTDLIVLLDGGEWMLLWPSEGAIQSASGLPLPRGKIIALASDAETLWAVARVPGGLKSLPAPTTHASTSQPATMAPANRPPASTTLPATTATTVSEPAAAALPDRLVLLSLKFDQWTWVARGQLPDLPAQVPTTASTAPAADGAGLSMVVWQGLPIVARQQEQGAIDLLSYTQQGTWSAPLRLAPGFDVETFSLLLGAEQTPRPILWLAPTEGHPAGVIYSGGGKTWTGPTPLNLPPEIKILHNDRALAEAAERLRLIYQTGQPPQPYEQQFDLSGHPVGTPAEITLPGNTVGRVEWWMETAVMVALVFAMVAAMRRRRTAREQAPRTVQLPLAPMGLRLGAGIIDAIPILVGIALFAVNYDRHHPAAPDPFLEWVGLISFFVYLAHTTISELIAARTLGKLLFGLKVVSADGARPSAGAIVVRNLLRIIDLWLMGLPLLLIFYSPLRQRVGDIAAGTVVVTRTPVGSDEIASVESGSDKPAEESPDSSPPDQGNPA